ncbi:tRNA (guanosine(18)-2'-O)-methyltransferase [Euphorbia peplus]|nr:tRNA (guanosine(18)-2'-O)-methyltransferase [Euphorbia peplus]
MRTCKTLTLIRSSLPSLHNSNPNFHNSTLKFPLSLPSTFLNFPLLSTRILTRHYSPISGAVSIDFSEDSIENSEKTDTVKHLLNNRDDVSRLMKMERRTGVEDKGQFNRWFPYLDKFKTGDGDDVFLSSSEVLEVVGPHMMEERKKRFRDAVENRSYSVCLVVEGLSDFGNVSATFRSADALGIQSVHVISCDSLKRYKDNRHVSMGAEKWLDIELWDSAQECFKALKSRGYRIATTHVGIDAVSIYDMDWSCPTAIVVGNENRGISDDALALSDMHCSIPMKGMVDSFNVSVAAGILMHHAVCDRISRLGRHGDLTTEEIQILLAEFSLRHSNTTASIAHEHAKRKADRPMPKL